MEKASWDPLASNEVQDGDIIAAAHKRQIRNILKSYVGMYDAFSELIQNAMDAVDRRAVELDEDGYEKHLWIRIDLIENSFSIVDNGIAFKEKEFKSFLAPNISFKDAEKSRGNKGVGSTYLAYGFNSLRFATKGNGFDFHGAIENGREWLDDVLGIISRPVVSETEFESSEFDGIDRGSAFLISFRGASTRPKDLSWYGASTAEQWLYLLLAKTPLGAIRFLGDIDKSIHFDLTVVDKTGAITEASKVPASYLYPHTKINASVDLKEVLAWQAKLVAAGKDASALPGKYSKLNGIYEHFSNTDLLAIRNWATEPAAEEILKRYQVEAYGYFAYSTSVWDQLNDVQAGLRKGYRVLKGGLQLSNNRMLQGEVIVIPLTSNTGYQNQTHVIVHFRGADPDLGRKGFQPELKDAAELVSVSIVNRHKRWKGRLLKSDTGAKANIAKELELHEWIKQQEAHEVRYPLVINNKNFFAPVREISICSTPQSEQDVIVLFNQLIAGGVIRGIRLLATNQITQYDGIYKFEVREPLQNHVYDRELNPLGVEAMRHTKAQLSAPKVLEYKFNLDALMREFESAEKSEKDVHLAIVWEMGQEWRKRYEATSLLDLDNIHQREFHGLTHVLNSGTTQFFVIALQELVDYLNDADAVQKYQKDVYSGDD